MTRNFHGKFLETFIWLLWSVSMARSGHFQPFCSAFSSISSGHPVGKMSESHFTYQVPTDVGFIRVIGFHQNRNILLPLHTQLGRRGRDDLHHHHMPDANRLKLKFSGSSSSGRSFWSFAVQGINIAVNGTSYLASLS